MTARLSCKAALPGASPHPMAHDDQRQRDMADAYARKLEAEVEEGERYVDVLQAEVRARKAETEIREQQVRYVEERVAGKRRQLERTAKTQARAVAERKESDEGEEEKKSGEKTRGKDEMLVQPKNPFAAIRQSFKELKENIVPRRE